jgi:hypothetical protein
MRELIMWLLKCSFDNAKYFEFVDKARAMGITVPYSGNKTHCGAKHLQILPTESTCLKI